MQFKIFSDKIKVRTAWRELKTLGLSRRHEACAHASLAGKGLKYTLCDAWVHVYQNLYSDQIINPWGPSLGNGSHRTVMCYCLYFISACEFGQYGAKCKEKCNCTLGNPCYHVNGQCECPPGLTGSSCEHRKYSCTPGVLAFFWSDRVWSAIVWRALTEEGN